MVSKGTVMTCFEARICFMDHDLFTSLCFVTTALEDLHNGDSIISLDMLVFQIA